MIKEVEFIVYTSDQEESKKFYSKLFDVAPCLDVPGMVEFKLNPGVKFGIMPEKGIKKIIGDTLPDPASGNGIPRCELYIKVKDAQLYLERAIGFGAQLVDEFKLRDWGDKVGYVSDRDGNVVAIAE